MSLITELQAQAVDENSSTAALLRKALLVASKLGLDDVAAWCDQELTGYEKHTDIPPYRHVAGNVMAWNPLTERYERVRLGDAQAEAAISTMRLPDPIGELEAHIRKASEQPGRLMVNLAPEQAAKVRELMTSPMPVSLQVEPASFSRIVDTVRTAILKWSLQLERDGVLGEGVTFTGEEKAAARKDNARLRIDAYVGQTTNVVTVSRLPVHPAGTGTPESLDLEAVARLVEEISRSLSAQSGNPSLDEIRAEVDTLKTVLSTPRPKSSWVSDSLTSLKHLLENATGEVIVDGIKAGQYVEAIGRVLGLK